MFFMAAHTSYNAKSQCMTAITSWCMRSCFSWQLIQATMPRTNAWQPLQADAWDPYTSPCFSWQLMQAIMPRAHAWQPWQADVWDPYRSMLFTKFLICDPSRSMHFIRLQPFKHRKLIADSCRNGTHSCCSKDFYKSHGSFHTKTTTNSSGWKRHKPIPKNVIFM